MQRAAHHLPAAPDAAVTARADRRFGVMVATLVVLACACLALAFACLRQESDAMLAATQRQLLSHQLTDELRQSSDDLTRFVRSYVQTGDARYRRAFEDVLGMREGRVARPLQPGRAWWNLVPMDEADAAAAAQPGASWYAPPGALGQPVALHELMRRAGFNSAELALLGEAERQSEELVLTERQAMFLADQGNAAARSMASEMLFGLGYHRAKRAIAEPIEACSAMVAARSKAAVDAAAARLQRAQALFACAVAALLGLAMAVGLRARRRLNDLLGTSPEHLRSLLDALGESSAPPVTPAAPAAAAVSPGTVKHGGIFSHLRQLGERVHQLADANARLEQDILVRRSELRHAMEELTRNRTVSALGSMVAGVAHELNTPVGNALLASSTLEERMHALEQDVQEGTLRKTRLREMLAESAAAGALISRNLQRVAGLVDVFKLVAPGHAGGARERFLLRTLMLRTVRQMSSAYAEQKVEIRVDIDPHIALDSYPLALEQVVLQLVANAVQHGLQGQQGHRGGAVLHVMISAQLHDDHVVLLVRDDGVGMPEPVRQRSCEPFFTTALADGRSGLGLYLVHQLVHVTLDGHLAIQTAPGAGCCFGISLALAPKVPARPTEEPAMASA